MMKTHGNLLEKLISGLRKDPICGAKRTFNLAQPDAFVPGLGASPFFAKFDNQTTWLNEFKPVFGEARFFYQDALETFYRESIDARHVEDDEARPLPARVRNGRICAR